MNDCLMHYGVPGMKWGRRKSRISPRLKKSSDYKSTESLRKKTYKELSNSQLKLLNERMQLEQNYRRLNPKGIDRGLSVTNKLLAVIGTGGAVGALYGVVNSPYGKAAINAGKEILKNRL